MKIVIFLFPIATFAAFASMKLMAPHIYTTLIQEDSVMEYAQALAYFLASVLSFALAGRLLKSRFHLHGILYTIVAVALLFITMEEISWGQRIFHIATPDYFVKHNGQQEISMHNLHRVQSRLHRVYVMVGVYGAFAWILTRLFVRNREHPAVEFIVPDWFVSPYFLPVALLYGYFVFVSRPRVGGFLVWRDQEPAELLLSLGFLFFMVTNWMKLRSYLSAAQDWTECGGLVCSVDSQQRLTGRFAESTEKYDS